MPDIPPRDDNETTTRCPVCRTPFDPVRRQRYCTNACRQIAYRRRHHTPDPALPDLPTVGRRDHTVYLCGECDQRYLGEQWCPDCQRPCRRLGRAGSAPTADEPVAVRDLINTPEGAP